LTTYDVLAGVIIAAHGVQGAVKVRIATKTALQLINTGDGVNRRPVDVWIRPSESKLPAGPKDTTGRAAVITQLKEMQAGGTVYLAKIQDVRDRNQAEALIGYSVFGPQSRRAPLDSDEYFVEELIGLEVVGDKGRKYGKIRTVLQHPGNDVYETDEGALIPAVKAFVLSIDIAGGQVVVAELPGLMPEEAEELQPDQNVVEAETDE
jgi:16S rRNA processing protein RimM